MRTLLFRGILTATTAGVLAGLLACGKREPDRVPPAPVPQQPALTPPPLPQPPTSTPVAEEPKKEEIRPDAQAVQLRPSPVRRLALVIGIANYAHPSLHPLRNASRDATAVSDLFRSAGFSVQQVADASREALLAAVKAFSDSVREGDELAFYFSGHGFQFEDSMYLATSDTAVETVDLAKRSALRLSDVVQQLERNRPSALLAVLDACRDSPYQSQTKSVTARNLIGEPASAFAPPRGRMFVMSSSGGQASIDNFGPRDTSPYSLFTRVFLEEVRAAAQSLRAIMPRVRDRVSQLAREGGREQRPALIDELAGELTLFASSVDKAPNPPASGAVPSAVAESPRIAIASAAPPSARATLPSECRPDWPLSAIRNRDQRSGTVEAKIFVFASGRVDRVVIQSSTLPSAYEREVSRSLENCRFEPAGEDRIFEVPIQYRVE